MDAQAKKKLFRAKLNAQKQGKQRVDSPLVRYNEHDQPMCKVCDVVVKSESLWPAHLVSRKHHEAIEKFKATAAALNGAIDSKPSPPKELPKRKERSSTLPPDIYGELHEKAESSTAMPKGGSSTLPPDFFDNQGTKRPKKEGSISAKTQAVEPFVPGSVTETLTTSGSAQNRDSDYQTSKVSKVAIDSEAKQAKGSLPENFFDDKDADLRARGITPVKLDANDQYKEYEKLIKEDLQEVDDRLEEEEIDTADMFGEAESVEQRTRKEKMELLKRKKLELRASRSASRGKDIEVTRKELSEEDSSSDDENNENFIVDWRAKHL